MIHYLDEANLKDASLLFMSKKAQETPMMKQYREARESLEEDTLLLFRLGDFYEMFETDAERGAALLGITLTKRHDMPMAGIPFSRS